jgi:hypothetical protein
VDKVTKLDWQWSTNAVEAARLQDVNGKKFVHDWKVESLQSCSACHRPVTDEMNDLKSQLRNSPPWPPACNAIQIPRTAPLLAQPG